MQHGRIGFWYRFTVSVVRPLSVLLTTRDWRGAEQIPATGGVIVAANHLSYVDPMTFGHFVYNSGRTPRFLAKASLFTVPLVKYVFIGSRQIPVHRGTADAAEALSAGVDALRRGECLLIYPEGSATRDPDTWPMRAHTGVARLALTTGAPVIPCAQWGPQELWRYRTKRPHPFPRKRIQVLAGPPVDLSAYDGKPQDAQLLCEVTEVIMGRITDLLIELRGGRPPAVPYDPQSRGMTKAAVLGAGSWGTAFAQVLLDSGTDTLLWARREEMAEHINTRHENRQYLPGIVLPPMLVATTDAEHALADADVVVLAVPSQTLRENLAEFKHLIPRGATLVSLMKGVELGTDKRMSEVIREVADVPESQVAVITGPNLAREIASRQPAASVVACTDLDIANRVQAACHAGYFRPYTNHDVIGCELGGAIKNVIALAVGIAAGLGFGDNARASMMTRGLAETARIGQALGADPLTFAGLAGMGDLIATCTSPLSRNRTFGENLGRGLPMEQVVAMTKQTAEGVKSCTSILDLARKHDVAAPITEHVVKVVHEGMTVQELLLSLLARDPKHERDADV